MRKIFVDVGSSTVKIYHTDGGSVSLIFQKSIRFKDGFDSEVGIVSNAKKELYETIETILQTNPDAAIKIYATGIFRKMGRVARVAFVDEFFLRTKLFFNIVSQDLESFYLEMALLGKCHLKEPILLINIGGGSTELVVMYGDSAVERHNLDIGVGSITALFPTLEDSISGVSLENVVSAIQEMLPSMENIPRIAIYNGGELSYMRLVQYALKKNSFFADPDHPQVIAVPDFAKGNQQVFHEMTVADLEALMPHDPKWMHGARGCSAIAQAICQKYEIETIVPSDSNMVHGIVRKELRQATLSGSFRKHLDYILKVKQSLEKEGIKILSPRFEEAKNPGETFVVFLGEEGMSPLELERHHLKSIEESDALVVCNPAGYVGASALIEIGFANALGKRIIFTEKPEEFMLNTLPAEIGV